MQAPLSIDSSDHYSDTVRVAPLIMIPPSGVNPFSDDKVNTPPSPFTKVNIEISSETTTPASTRPSSQPTNNGDNSSSSSKGQGLSLPGLAPPSSFVSQLFYETVRNTQSPVSCQTPSSTGATKGEDSGEVPEDTPDHDDLTTHMSPSRGNSSRAHDEQGNTSLPKSSQRRYSASAPQLQQHSFPRHSLSQSSFYATRSAPPEQYTSPSAYPSPPTADFVGQYMPSQPPHSMQTMAFFSSPFAHPGIHAHDPSAMGLHFPPPPSMGRTFTYPPAPAPTAETEHDPRSPQGYISNSPSPFAPTTSGSQVPSSSAPQTSSRHNFAPPAMHFSPPSGPHYGYPSPSYAQPSPGLFAYPAGPYTQSFYAQPAPTSPEDANKGGTWWYLPPSGSGQQFDVPPYPGLYQVQGYQPSMQMMPEFDRSYHMSTSGAGPSGQQQAQQQHVPQRQPTFPPPSPIFPSPLQSSGPSPAVSTPPNHPSSSSHSVPSPTQAKRPGFADNTSVSSPPRKSYHPNPPPNRSEWVMWVGNVPADATHDELYRFFDQFEPQHPVPPGTSAILSSRLVQPPSSPIPDERWGGVSSVFLISRSNCAFINFKTEAHLLSAVAHFNGKPLRPKDPRCPRLVCRVRRKDDDLRAGVGGQRGMGLHTRWVEEQKAREKEKRGEEGGGGGKGEENVDVDGPPTSPSTYLAPSSSSDPSPPIPAISPVDNEPHYAPVSSGSSPEDADKKPRHGSSGDRSFASTNSSLFAQHFPQRYFILKSLTQYDLNLSVERGVWATQPHNEGILDQAYRTSKEVYLIFGANKTGEFFGYAKMAGPIFHTERVEQAPWASRSGHRESSPIPEEEEQESRPTFLTPGSERPLNESPAAITPEQETQGLRIASARANESLPNIVHRGVNSAPTETQPHEQLQRPTLPIGAGTYPDISERRPAHVEGLTQDGRFVLKYPGLRPSGQTLHTTSGVVPKLGKFSQHPRLDDYAGGRERKPLDGSDSPPAQEESAQNKLNEKPDGWGREFKVQWICTLRLPFHRTRHLRNPWNQDREVKVSRDGTELEPSVGQCLLEEWDKPEPTLAATASASSPSTSPIKPSRSRPAGRAGASSSTAQAMPSFTSQITRTGTGASSGRGRGAHT